MRLAGALGNATSAVVLADGSTAAGDNVSLIISNNIFSGLEHTVPDVEVKFAGYGQPIKALTVTKIAFWNAGTETIKKQDVVKDDPIAVQGKEGIVFLSASVIECVSPLNKLDCKLKSDRSLVNITFEYLDYNQGGNIQVFHTGYLPSSLILSRTRSYNCLFSSFSFSILIGKYPLVAPLRPSFIFI